MSNTIELKPDEYELVELSSDQFEMVQDQKPIAKTPSATQSYGQGAEFGRQLSKQFGMDDLSFQVPQVLKDAGRGISQNFQSLVGSPSQAAPQAPQTPQGPDPKIAAYAHQYKLDYATAEKILRGRGYGR